MAVFESDWIECPYCGHEHCEGECFFPDKLTKKDLVCCGCGKVFTAHRNISITYSTLKKEK